MSGRREPCVDAQLDHGEVRLWTQVLEDRPGAVVETPVGAKRRPFADELRDAGGQLDAAGRWVLLLVQLGGKSAEVVDRARVLVAGDERAGNVAVCGDAEDRV